MSLKVKQDADGKQTVEVEEPKTKKAKPETVEKTTELNVVERKIMQKRGEEDV